VSTVSVTRELRPKTETVLEPIPTIRSGMQDRHARYLQQWQMRKRPSHRRSDADGDERELSEPLTNEFTIHAHLGGYHSDAKPLAYTVLGGMDYRMRGPTHKLTIHMIGDGSGKVTLPRANTCPPAYSALKLPPKGRYCSYW
jgi:hypothetical protein